MRVVVFGLGEAGSLFAADLAAAGVATSAFDPAPVPTPSGVTRSGTPLEAVAGADLVIALTAANDARTARLQAIDAIPRTALYADLSTSPPALKRELAGLAGAPYVDVALMGVVPGNGLRTPALVSGPAAARYAELLAPLGAPIGVLHGDVGDATTRKLLRSVTMKGLAAVIVEALRAAESVDLQQWLWRNIVDELTAADEALLQRLVAGTRRHALRRRHEMEASAALVTSLGVEPLMTSATVESLRRVLDEGVPEVPRGSPTNGCRPGPSAAAH